MLELLGFYTVFKCTCANNRQKIGVNAPRRALGTTKNMATAPGETAGCLFIYFLLDVKIRFFPFNFPALLCV